MPRRARPAPIEQQAREEVRRELDEMAAAIAAEVGPAEGAEVPSDDREVDLWGRMDPRVDPVELKALLMQGAVPPEWVDEQSDRRLALLRAHPEMAQMFAEPLDDEMAGIVADLATYPFRMAVLAPYEDDPQAQVAKARSVNGRWLRRAGRATDREAPPDDGASYEAPVAEGGA